MRTFVLVLIAYAHAHYGFSRSILARLRDSDWKIELDFLGDEGIETLSNMPVVRQSTKLTEGCKDRL